ncbi:MAG: hypothetical protein ACOCRO_06980 [Halanaerobiales bacterium]
MNKIKKRNKDGAKKIFFSLLMLVIVFSTIVSFTYAWYVRQNSAALTNITMSSGDSPGIQMSSNGVDWKSTLTTGDEDDNINIDEDLLIDSISTSSETIDGEMQFYSGDMVDNKFKTTLLTEPLYHKFDFYILNGDDTDKQLSLGLNSSVTDKDDKELSLSTRAGFINLGSSDNPQDAIDLNGEGIDNTNYIWEPNSTTRGNRLDMYQQDYIEEGKLEYKGINKEADDLDLEQGRVVNDDTTSDDEVVKVDTEDPINAGNDNAVTILDSDKITKMRVYIWCEGQDIDCNNSISGASSDINLEFVTNDVQEEDGEYTDIEKFNEPNISNPEGARYTWDDVSTNLESSNNPDKYIIKISRDIDGELMPVRTEITENTEVDIDQLDDLEFYTHYVEVSAYKKGVGLSDYSNRLSFQVLPPPENISVSSDNVLSWSDVSYAEDYTVNVENENTNDTYFTTTSSLTLDLEDTVFDNSETLASGETYRISISSNGQQGYSRSEFSDEISWGY